MIAVESVAFWTAKRGNSEAEWEDHFALDEALGRFAVADGASSSSKAAAWAATLTEGFLCDPFDAGSADALGHWIDRRCLHFDELNPSAPEGEVNADNWMQHAAAGQHGFATFLGVAFSTEATKPPTCRWVGVGDSCLFHTRGGKVLNSAPFDSHMAFGTHPDLISSNLEHREQAVVRAFRGQVDLRGGDTVLLATDALAEWALKIAPDDPVVWRVLSEIDQPTFDRLVGDLRDSEQIVNDDVTLVRCQVGV